MRSNTLLTLVSICDVRRELTTAKNNPTVSKAKVLEISHRVNTLVASLILSDKEFVELLKAVVKVAA